MPSFRTHLPMLACSVVAIAAAACTSGDDSAAPTNPLDSGSNDASSTPLTDAPSDVSTPSDASQGTTGDGAADGGASDSAVSDAAIAPTVVATFTEPTAGLAIDNGYAYVSVSETPNVGYSGFVAKVPTSSANATVDAGASIFASGLRNAGTIAVNGGIVYWTSVETAFPDHGGIWAAPVTGGPGNEVLSAVTPGTHFAFAGNTLVLTDENTSQILAWNVGAPSTTIVYQSTASSLTAPDSDGTNAFFLHILNASTADLVAHPVSGGALETIVPAASGASSAYDYVVHDANNIYWTNLNTEGSIYAIAKTAADAGAAKLLATLSNGKQPQLLVDGTNLYALTPSQLVRIPLGGGAPTVLASVTGSGGTSYVVDGTNANALGIGVDDTYVYWLYEGQGELLKLPK